MSTPVNSEIEVEITLIPTNELGRHSPILQSEYRGVLGVLVGNFSVRFEVREEQFAPGQSKQVGIQFLYPDEALPNFPVGAVFSVWEGRVIGHGRVLKINMEAIR